MASDGFGSVWGFRDRSGFCLCLHVTGLLHLLCLLMGAPPPPLLKEWSCCIPGVSNVWSGLRRLRLPDQGLVSPASPVLLSESPSGWCGPSDCSPVANSLDYFSCCRYRWQD
ncbi:unnamed protein product [Brassica rapa]|uniref:Uncharacterized protein n=1 Tax=Brassica campestris TaxID=3711 RepID=A0A8D9DP08_BRACM|nr:unnamed protein product [Brassica rapa]